ncbi:hypothetical protein E5288_WYG000016 [Bos mutus]|uniref:Uncharacterized protein n=1 Tax=Bos mutus TaxID=72004 RepID=A0A6B0RJI2_9CETA|nr:hypothetical protein [Bos mutus]
MADLGAGGDSHTGGDGVAQSETGHGMAGSEGTLESETPTVYRALAQHITRDQCLCRTVLYDEGPDRYIRTCILLGTLSAATDIKEDSFLKSVSCQDNLNAI